MSLSTALLACMHAHISSSASCVGVAAAAGKMAKDAKYLAIVEKAGDDFIPLVVESFGIWTPFALSVLHSIADHTTTVPIVAFHLKWPEETDLLQQFSVCLWTNNA